MEKMLTVSSSPHIRSSHSTQTIMRDVVIALIPGLLAGIYFYGPRALWLTFLSVLSCVLFEYLWCKWLKKPCVIGDLSAVVTGMLLAFNLPVKAPSFIVIVGACVAIILAKQIFGGIGQNFINPALAGRAFLLAAYPTAMRTFTVPLAGKWGIDAVTTATPLELLKNNQLQALPSFLDAFAGNIGGCIGEASSLALLIGAAYLLYKGVIKWQIPICYLGTLFVLTWILSGEGIEMSFYGLFLGGAIMGAFFMATDYTTTPMTIKGQVIFAVGAGIITAIIRLFGGYPEGVSYSLLIMNLTVPLIDRYVKVQRFGGGEH